MDSKISIRSLPFQVSALDWDCHDAVTRYLTHSIHRYSGKFIPQVARQMIELLSAPREIILDPFCGSGTTLLEAALYQRRSIGIDLNPVATMISKVKCTPLSETLLSRELANVQTLLSTIGGASRNGQLSLRFHTDRKWNSDPRLGDSWYLKWFQRPVLEQLVAIYQTISSIGNVHVRNLTSVAFSNILRKSSNASSAYPNVMFDRSITSRPLPLKPFLLELHKTCAMVTELHRTVSGRTWYAPQVILADSRAIPLPDKSVDAIITHPPYIGSIPYAEYQQLSLHWFGHESKALDTILIGGRRQAKDVLSRYRLGMRETLLEIRRVLKPGRMIGFLIGDPLVHGRRVSLFRLISKCASECELHLIAAHRRRGINHRANKMSRERVVFFQRPD